MLNLSANVAEHLAQPHRNFEPGHDYILSARGDFPAHFQVCLNMRPCTT